jgi:hypothetical protein
MTVGSDARIVEAREQSGLLTLELCCEDADCSARTVDVAIKDHDRTLLSVSSFKCPLCGSTLKLHHARTAEENQIEQDAAARRSVNRQMFERDAETLPASRLQPSLMIGCHRRQQTGGEPKHQRRNSNVENAASNGFAGDGRPGSPIASQISIDVEGWRRVAGRCPSR